MTRMWLCNSHCSRPMLLLLLELELHLRDDAVVLYIQKWANYDKTSSCLDRMVHFCIIQL